MKASGEIFGELFAPRQLWALSALLVFQAAGIAIVREAHNVRFECPQCLQALKMDPTKDAGLAQ
jgi:hypothetical protein